MSSQLTVGPLLFHWPVKRRLDFYARIADEAPVDRVYLGEVVCAKRDPAFRDHYAPVAERLRRAGKEVVFSSLAEIMIPQERRMTAALCAREDGLVEANDAAALYHLRGRSHAIGPFVNTYNEHSLGCLARRGARHFTLPPELPARAQPAMVAAARCFGVSLEVQVYGRVPLALSARCYHARAHGRVKDDCEFVCAEDPDGMALSTLIGQPFLAINGIQTLSYASLNLLDGLADMQALGIDAFRISPHSADTVAIAALFRAVLDGHVSPPEASRRLGALAGGLPFCNGFYHGTEGYKWLRDTP